jgi:hypothetical protein
MNVNSLKKLFVLALIAGTNALIGCITSGNSNDASSENAARTQGTGANGVSKVTICHIPPGNPSNAHSITVGSPAVRAHLDHGDVLGACSEVIPPVDNIPPDNSLPPVDELN